MTTPPDNAALNTSGISFQDEQVMGFGMAMGGPAKVVRPTNTEQLADVFAQVRKAGGSVALRGAGCSYGDASTNNNGRVLDMTAMNRILSFDAQTGIAMCEPGVTVRDLWRRSIGSGYWPRVVSGTMAVSMGGAAAMNIHGKNNYALGSFGEGVRSFELMTPSGELVQCSRVKDPELFHAAISGFGMLGCFTKLEIQTKRVNSGRLRVSGIVARDIEHGSACWRSIDGCRRRQVVIKPRDGKFLAKRQAVVVREAPGRNLYARAVGQLHPVACAPYAEALNCLV